MKETVRLATVHSSTPTNVPLLNQYKHALLRRRLLQTLTGGVKIRKAPWYIHLIQLSLWIAPFLFALPFIVVSSLGLWNQYYNALVYGCTQGLCVLLMETIGAVIRHLHSRNSVKTAVGGAQLDDEDSVDFDIDMCCSFETFDFIFAHKKIHSLILHPLVSGLFAFSGYFLLQPSVLLESMHVAGVVFVSIIGWYTVCSAHYSLNVSPPQAETGTYRPTDPLELRFLKRPFYVVAIAAIFILMRLFIPPPSVTLYLQLLYAALCLLPLGWLVGFLPPLDALIPWIMEQGLTRLMGGSPMATDLRLTVMFLISSIFVAIVVSLHDDILSLLLATTFGFLLSQDVFTCLKSPVYLLSFISKSKFLQSVRNQITTKTFTSLSGWDVNALSELRLFVFHYLVSLIKGAALLGTSLVIMYFTFTSGDELGTRITAGLVIGLFCLLQGSHMFQRLYLLRIFRNPFFPRQYENVTKFDRKRRLLHYFGIPGGFINAYLAPLLLLSFVGFSLKLPSTSLASSIKIPTVWNGLVVARILRKVWQNTSSAHFEVTVVAVLHFIIPSNNQWVSLGSAFQVFIIGLATEVVQDFFQKAWFVTTAFANFIFIRKLRTHFSLNVLITVVTFIFLPFLLAIIFISSLFSSPLLPLFTLPIFVVSFPRTKRFWPSLINYASSYSKCEDSIYYGQAETEIVKVLHRTISSGVISASPGTFLLLRFEDRLITVSFLERGYGHCSFVIKGLELQETSCHSIEAMKIDDIFEDAYDPVSKGCPKFWFNIHFSNTLHPVDSEVIKVYSDAHNVLTGIIDQPSSLQRFPDNLLKCLVWVFLRHFLYAIPSTSENENTLDIEKASPLDAHCKTNCDSRQTEETKETDGSKNAWSNSAETYTKLPVHVDQQHCDTKRGTTISWSESISSFDDVVSMHADKLNAESIYTLDAVNSLPGLIPQDRPLDNPDIRHTVITTESAGRPNNVDDNIAQSEVRQSAIPMSGISRMQLTGYLEATCCLNHEIPRRWTEDLPLKHSQLNNFKNNISNRLA